MSRSRKVLIVSGLILALWGMAYGLYYALFEEHQTLGRMGERLATGFARAAERQMSEADAALDAYASTKFEYVRKVDVHSHWGGLALLLMLFGVIFDQVAFKERKRVYLAVMLVAGSAAFPLGVMLQTVNRGIIPQVVAVAGSGLLIAALGAVAFGFLREETVD